MKSMSSRPRFWTEASWDLGALHVLGTFRIMCYDPQPEDVPPSKEPQAHGSQRQTQNPSPPVNPELL